MKSQILKKINKHVRIEESNGSYYVKARKYDGLFSGWGNWHTLNMFSSYRKAVERKNTYIVMVIMRELGYRNELVKRRTNRKRAKGLI